MIHQNPLSRGEQVEARMETVPYTFMDAQSLMQFYAILFCMLVAIYGGGLVVALACILWLLRFDETPPWITGAAHSSPTHG
jgi:hypothetical protein